jgi:hypothetical protein
MLNPEMSSVLDQTIVWYMWLSSAPLHRGVQAGARPYPPGCLETPSEKPRQAQKRAS